MFRNFWESGPSFISWDKAFPYFWCFEVPKKLVTFNPIPSTAAQWCHQTAGPAVQLFLLTYCAYYRKLLLLPLSSLRCLMSSKGIWFIWSVKDLIPVIYVYSSLLAGIMEFVIQNSWRDNAMLWASVSVCLLICQQDNSKSCNLVDGLMGRR